MMGLWRFSRMNAMIFATSGTLPSLASVASTRDGELAFAFEQQRVGLLHGADRILADAAAAHPDDIDAGEAGNGLQHEAEGNDIVAQTPRYPATIDALADVNVLVHGAMAAEKHMVADMAMPAKHGVVGE